jgi:cytochrome P450
LTCRASPQARCATGPTKNILGLDGEQYHRLRRLVSKAFAPRAAERLRTQILEIITELVDPLTTAGHSDVLANTASANRDPAVYDNPDRLYITREGPRPCSRSAMACTTVSAPTSPASNSPRPCV